MNTQARLFSEAYCPVKLCSPFAAGISQSLWSKIMREQETGRTFLRMEYAETGKDWICPIGQPITTTVAEFGEELTSDVVFIPTWICECAGFPGVGEVATITIFTQEAFPESTKLILRVVDSAFYNSEIKAELEQALSHIGVVKKHSLLQIPIADLGGFQVEVFVADTEPADVVLCNGDEVVVEFEEPLDQFTHPVPVPGTTRPLTPIPLFPEMMLPSIDGPLTQTTTQTGFTAFQGQGQTLGGSNADLPEWRRNLPPRPPRRREE